MFGLLLVLFVVLLFMYDYRYRTERFEGQGNFVPSPAELEALKKKFRTDPIYHVIGGYVGPETTGGAGSDWNTAWRGPMISNGWKY